MRQPHILLACACGGGQICSAFIPAQISSSRAQPTQLQSSTAASSDESSTSKPMTSWRDKVELLLNPRLSLSERRTLSKDLLNDLPQIRDDVQDAVDRGGPRAVINELVLAPGSEARRTVAGIRSVRRQIREDILPELRKGAKDSQQSREMRERFENVLQKEIPEALQKAAKEFPDKLKKADLSPQGACKIADSVREEALNAVSRTPAGLYTPSYDLAETGPFDSDTALPQYEIRQYGAVSLVSAAMSSKSGSQAASGDAFNVLAGYLFGKNQASESMSMTTPVTIDIAQSGSEEGSTSSSSDMFKTMSFVLPDGVTAADAPSPVDSSVMLRELPPQLVAAREFTGFATPNEVRRQIASLKESLEGTKYTLAELKSGQPEAQLLQYNAPYTLPWIRRNEIILKLVDADGESADDSLAATATDSDTADASTESAWTSAATTPDFSGLDPSVRSGEGSSNPTASYLESVGSSTAGTGYAVGDSVAVSGESPKSPTSGYLDALDGSASGTAPSNPATNYLETVGSMTPEEMSLKDSTPDYSGVADQITVIESGEAPQSPTSGYLDSL